MEKRGRISKVRERFQRERPTLEVLVTSGECEPPVPQEAYRELRVLVHALKTARERLGLGLPEVAERSGIDEAMLNRLETGASINPTIDILWRYSSALGQCLTWTVCAAENGSPGTLASSLRPKRRRKSKSKG